MVHPFACLLALTLALAWASPAATIAAGPATAPSPASRPTQADRRRALELSRKASDLVDARKWAEAERTLNDALALVPDDYVCLYNLALVHASTDRNEVAVQDLGRATAAGFTDFDHLKNDPAFVPLRELPSFRRLLGRQDEIRHAAAARMLAELKSQLGDRYEYALDEYGRLAFAARLDRPALDAAIEDLQVERASELEQLFSHPPDEMIRVIIASSIDFNKLEHRVDVGGHYDDATRTILVKRPGPELRHEFTHALHAADQHALGQEHPVWLSEGLATLYEYPAAASPTTAPAAAPAPTSSASSRPAAARRMYPADTWRLARVQAAARHGTLIPLETLLKMERPAFNVRAELAYGESGSLLLYLYTRGLLKPFYDAYTAGYPQDRTGCHALEATTGVPLSQLQKDWSAWLLPRPVPRQDGLGVRR